MMRYPDGTFYKGNWANQKRNGQGIFQYGNGIYYQGEWIDDQRHGNGTIKINNETAEGIWERDNLVLIKSVKGN